MSMVLFYNSAPLGYYVHDASALTCYVMDRHAGKEVTPPDINKKFCNAPLATRFTMILLDVGMGISHPLGVGYNLRGVYWQPLEDVPIPEHFEIAKNIQQAKQQRRRIVPQTNHYSAQFAEFGVPGFALYLLLCGLILFRGLSFAKKQKEGYVWSMTCVYVGMLACGIAIYMGNTFMFFTFSGYLYAVGTPQTTSRSWKSSI